MAPYTRVVLSFYLMHTTNFPFYNIIKAFRVSGVFFLSIIEVFCLIVWNILNYITYLHV